MTVSLLGGLHLAFRGLQNTEQHIKIAAQNITNADREGYTRKTFRADYVTGNFGTVPIGGTVYSALNASLLEGVVDDTTSVGKKNVIAEFLDVYVRRAGNVVSDFSLTSTLNDLFSHLDLLAVAPENRAQKGQIVSDAEVIALYLRDMSDAIQNQRTDAELEIGKTIDRINQSLEVIADINDKIIRTSGKNAVTLTEYEDQRALEIQKLSEEIEITFYLDDRNRMQIYHPGGQPMLLSRAIPLQFNPAATLTSAISFPANLDDIQINGVNSTAQITGGKLGGLLELRDGTLVEEQEKFDAFATELMDTLNAVLNTGASRPPRNQLIGEAGFGAADPFGATGIVRIGITDDSGVVQSFTDVDLTVFATVGDAVTALNALPGITASLDPDGRLVVDSIDPTLGISINEMTSDVGADNRGFSHFFGLNNMFTGLGAEDIQVAEYLRDDSDHLAIGQLSGSAGLGIGDIGITVGDSTVVQALSTSLDTAVSFNAAGDFSAQNVSLRVYAESIMSRAALKGSIAANELSAAESIRQQGADFMNNVSGVNIDEETAILLELESHYQASAHVISVIRGLLEELMNAVR
ncbi:MAG: hypothetical protein JKY11_03450 [Alphaproteobacteria bacterium]|nr:hypothetical protein [Alphaproteobacteria bacterium]